ncbi:MAG: beta-N-acetylhexosaminidase, partial [Prevotella sp.]|nr:beta-N-acetylhexosaminidase [Prevotella sp.]
VHYRMYPAMQTLAVKMWTGAKPTIPFNEFDTKRRQLSEAPDVNVAGRYPKGVVLKRDMVKAGQTLPLQNIGWNYSVSFDVEAAKESRGTILFQSSTADFYISDPVSGKLAFSRDGYLNTFNYSFYPGEKAHVRVTGNQTETSLYVNGRLVETLGIKTLHRSGNVTMKYISTLTFPLRQVGKNLNSKIKNLKVESL